MNWKNLLTLIVIIAIVVFLGYIIFYSAKKMEIPINSPVTEQTPSERYCAPNENISDGCICQAKNVNGICVDYASE